MESLNIGIVIDSADLLDEVRAALNDLPVRVLLEQREIGDTAALIEKVDRVQPDILLLGVQPPNIVVLGDFIRQVKATSGSPMVVIVNTSSEPETILRAVRSGADEYLYPPLGDDLRAAFERMGAERAKRRAGTMPRGKMFAFVGAKGGCGTTTLACHLAIELHRQTRLQVLLADCDLGSGIIGFLLKCQSRYSILDALASAHRLDLSLWKALVSNGQPGVEVIMAPANPGQAASADISNLHYVISLMRANYDWTVIDFGRGLSPALLNAVEEIDETWLVTTLEIPALHQTKQIVQTLLQAGYGQHRLHVLLNRTPRRMDVTLEELDRMIGVPIYASLPNDYLSLSEVYSEGNLLPPNTNLGRHFARVAARMAGLQHTEKKKRFSLLDRLAG